MIQFEDSRDSAHRLHHGGWTGFCPACGMIWPCPATRATLKMLFTEWPATLHELDATWQQDCPRTTARLEQFLDR
jgi:hypothetical protein